MFDSLNFEQFCSRFDNEETCIRAIYASKWPNGFHCPRCDYSQAYEIRTRRLPLYECRSCGHQTSLVAGTIFQGSRTPLRLWFQAVFLHALPGGISAVRLQSIIATTYKTAWLICHKIRHAMTEADKHRLLTGVVHINCGQYGNPYNPTVYQHPQEHILMIGASMDKRGGITHVKIKQVPEDHLHAGCIIPWGRVSFIKHHVHPHATEVVAVLKKFRSHTLKPLKLLSNKLSRWLNHTFKGIGPKHLQAYLNQFAYQMSVSYRQLPAFRTLFRLCVTTPTITYPMLIREKDTKRMSRAWFEYRAKRAALAG